MENIPLGKVDGHNFWLDEQNRFVCDYVKGSYESMAKLREAIETKDKVKVAQNRKKLCLAVIDKDGVRRELAGVHAGHGKPVLKPPFSDRQEDDLYPYVDWIEQAIVEKNQLQKQIDILNEILWEFRLEKKSGYGFHPDQHAAEVERLEGEYADKLKAAQKTNLKAMRAKTPEPKKRRIRF